MSKHDAFKQIVSLHDKKIIHGFGGKDSNPDPAPKWYRWSATSDTSDISRALLYYRWSIRGKRNKLSSTVTFKDAVIAGISNYDGQGYSKHSSEFRPTNNTEPLIVGMSSEAALEQVKMYLSFGHITELSIVEHYVSPPSTFDETAYKSMEPWNKWQLGVSDYGGFWLTFKNNELIRIHHRIQKHELP